MPIRPPRFSGRKPWLVARFSGSRPLTRAFFQRQLTNAIKRALGDHAYKVAISATKSLIGHGLGASGGMETVATVKTIETGTIHPTINLHTPDPTCDLDYVPNTARKADVRVALKNSFGFGGQNSCLVILKYEK